ncbi:MAG: hypothetical protein U0937_03710 [Thermodesulfovibrionia bacterium]|nr:hypothetical protein [Thermodesulfovibrionia bacterium]
MDILTKAAKYVLNHLEEKEREEIKKDNPFRNDRNEAIRRLRVRGIKITVLMEITGICRSHLINITRGITERGRTEQLRREKVIERIEND